MFCDITVNCSSGNDEIDIERSPSLPYRTIDRAMELSKTGSKIFVYPGNYSGVDIETETQNSFEYTIQGTGKNVIFNYVKHNGYINSIYHDISIKDLIYNCSNTETSFTGVNFCGGYKFMCRGIYDVNENPQNEIEFNNCSFGINFQIIVESGMFKITFKNCKFSKGTIPVIFVKNGDVEVDITFCNVSNILLNNLKGFVYIYHTSCIFKDRIWSGKECMVVSSDVGMTLSGQRSTKSCYDKIPEQGERKIVQKHTMDDLYKGVEVDTDEFTSITLKSVTEFVYVIGKNPLTVILPDEDTVPNSHYIQILNSGTVVIINDLQYSNRIINIRYLVGRGWIYF